MIPRAFAGVHSLSLVPNLDVATVILHTEKGGLDTSQSNSKLKRYGGVGEKDTSNVGIRR